MKLITLAQYNQLEAVIENTAELTWNDRENIENILELNVLWYTLAHLEQFKEEVICTYIGEMSCEREYQADTGTYEPQVIERFRTVMDKCVEVLDHHISKR